MSTHIKNAVPASLRKPVESVRFAQGLMGRAHMHLPTTDGRMNILAKSLFTPLPEEPEDAKLTGVTRSLNRRLLALNIKGSLMRSTTLVARTA